MSDVRNNNCVGILGAGQLSMLLCKAARDLDIQTVVWGTGAEDSASNYASSYQYGELDKEKIQVFFKDCQFITLESEFYASDYLKELFGPLSERIIPQLNNYQLLETKIKEKEIFSKHGFKVIPFSFEPPGEYPYVIKLSSGGYDGKGNFIVKNKGEEGPLLESLKGKEYFFEPFLKIKRELALTAVSSGTGTILYPFIETIQKNSICTEVVIGDYSNKELETKVINFFNEVSFQGTLAFEFIEDESGNIYFNESAPRVHNSSHYTSDLCEVSQFHNHLLAVLGKELGGTKLKHDHGGMINIIAGSNWRSEKKKLHSLIGKTGIAVYDYEKKEGRLGRKMGHINYWANSIDECKKIRNLILGVMA